MELSGVAKEYEKVQQQLKKVKAQRRAIAEEMLVQRALISAIRLIPPELLGLIFLCYIEDFKQSPWTLMGVSRAWRAAALHTRGLWARIMITSPDTSRRSRRERGREVCINTDQLQRALARAGTHPLDIALFHLEGDGPKIDKIQRLVQTGGLPMLALMKKMEKVSQVRRLEVTNVWMIKVENLIFLNLKYLIINARISQHILDQITESAPNLTSLEVNNIWSWSSIPKSSRLKLSSVQEMMFNLGNPRSYDPLCGNFRDCLSIYPSLKRLEVQNIGQVIVRAASEPLIFSHLQALVLINSKRFWAINALNLTTLTLIKDSSLAKVHGTSPNDFPSLHTLTLSSSNLSALGAIRAPFLHTFDLRCTAGVMSSPETYSGFIQILIDGQISPQIFHLHDTAIMPLILVEIINNMPRLEELRLRSVVVKQKFFEALAGSNSAQNISSSDHTTYFPCPSLIKLSIDCSELKQRIDSKVIKPAAQKAITARVKAGHSMEEARLRITKEQYWINLLP